MNRAISATRSKPNSTESETRICIVTETFSPEVNGVANTLNYLVKGMQAKGIYTQVIRPRQAKQDQGSVSAEAQQVCVPGLPIPGYPELKFGLPAKARLERLWRLQRPKAVYVATEGPLGWSAVRAARKLQIPVVSGFHTNFQSYSNFYQVGWLENLIMSYLRFVHNQTLATLVPTRAQQAWLEQERFHNVRVVSRGVNGDLFSPTRRSETLRRQWGASGQQKVFIYVGRIAAEKNIKLAIKAFEQIQARDAGARFVLVGDGPLRTSLEKAHPEFIFCGMKTGIELAEHFASGDVFVFPSKTETFGNVVTEAMASGLAVISFDLAAAHEHLRHEHSGMLCHPDDEAGFVQCALQLAQQTELVETLRHEAYAIAKQLTWDNIVEQFLQCLLPSPVQFCGEPEYGYAKSIDVA